MEEKKLRWIFILMAKKRSFLPSVRPIRKREAGKQNFTQVLPWGAFLGYLNSSRFHHCSV